MSYKLNATERRENEPLTPAFGPVFQGSFHLHLVGDGMVNCTPLPVLCNPAQTRPEFPPNACTYSDVHTTTTTYDRCNCRN